MQEFIFRTEQWLPRSLEEVFVFFSEARNLETLTPPWLNFEVLTPDPIIMRVGALIDYRIKVHHVWIRWRTQITVWNPPHGFTDVQLRGPYTLWHHTHAFASHQGGTQCMDEVRYRPRGGILTHWLFVRRDVEKIFQYRRQRLADIFSQ